MDTRETSINRIPLLLAIVALSVVMGLIIWFGTPRIERPQAPLPISSEVRQMTPQEHLIDAKEVLRSSKEFSLTEYWDIKSHLDAIPRESAEWKESRLLMQRITKKKADFDKKQVVEEKQRPIEARKDFAVSYENECLNRGMDARVTTLGAGHTTLKIQFVLINRPFAHQFNNDNDIRSRLTGLGFSKVILTNGFDDTWTIKL